MQFPSSSISINLQECFEWIDTASFPLGKYFAILMTVGCLRRHFFGCANPWVPRAEHGGRNSILRFKNSITATLKLFDKFKSVHMQRLMELKLP